MLNHGINVQQQSTSVVTPQVATSGIPFAVGTAPLHSASSPANKDTPVLCTSWDEAVKKFGYSDDWEKYTLCEVMYSHFKLYGCQPLYLCAVTDVTKTTEVAGDDLKVENHQVKLPFEALETHVVVAKTGNQGALVKDVDYTTFYDEKNLVIELLSDSESYNAETVHVECLTLSHEATTTEVANAMEKIETCLTRFGVVPDLIIAPGFSHDSVVAAVMATKADGINGMFKAKAICDLKADDYKGAYAAKSNNNIVDVNQIPCYGKLTLGNMKFHLSTQLAGLISHIDSNNEGCPYESPSNKNVKCDGVCDYNGEELALTVEQANYLNENGIVTVLNFFSGYVAWGNYNACYPSNTDVKDMFIATSRMFAWVGNSLIKTFWQNVDDPMNRRLIDTIIDAANIWLNGLVGRGYLLGARAEFVESENPLTDLMAGKIRIHVYITPPSPAQRIDFITEYDASYVSALFED